MIQLIAVDLDGTLLRSDGVPSPEGARALAQAAQRGVRVVLATARNPYSAGAFARAGTRRHFYNRPYIWLLRPGGALPAGDRNGNRARTNQGIVNFQRPFPTTCWVLGFAR